MKKNQYKGAQKRLVDLTGQKFGKLTVIKRFAQNNNQNQLLWECICDCGNMHIVCGNSLKSGGTQSCGCIGNSRGEQIIKELQEGKRKGYDNMDDLINALNKD